jgi:DNA-binding MarR family transcriptional regulator
MSWTATAYVKNLKVSPAGTPISKSEKLLLFVLADYHNEANDEAWMSVQRLAEESLQTQAEVVQMLQGLEKKKVLEIILDPNAPCTRPAHPRRTHRGA